MDNQVPSAQQVSTTATLDTAGFLSKIVEGIEADYSFAYPYNQFDEDKAHGALQKINGRIKVLKAFLENLK